MKLVSLYVIYIFLGLVIYFFGPIEYADKNKVLTFIYILNCYLLLFLGFFIGSRSFRLNTKGWRHESPSKDKELNIFIFSSVVTIFFNSYVVYDLYQNILAVGLDKLDSGVVYYLNLNSEKESGIITILMTLFSPFSFISINIGVKLYHKLKVINKLILCFVVISALLSYLLKGTNFGIFIVVVNIFISSYIYSMKFKYSKVKVLFIALFLLMFLFVFLHNLGSRLNIDYIPSTIAGVEINREHFIFTILPIQLSLPMSVAGSYISQGYYAVSLMFCYDFDSTLGFGSGYFLLDKFSSILGDDFFQNTYQYKMDEFWAYRTQWHTAFVWLSNDFGYYSVFALCFIFGILSAVVYKDAKINRGVVSTTLFSVISIILLFIPANNILMSNPFIFITFYSLLIIWLIRTGLYIRC
ncbi:O-antigen polymerase [Vibrio cholerae]|uniref:O-antigen polymerase n=1 Tax=Vibrio cholerae TaxID=666 RepID=UPI000A1ECA21|nr:O-antigen polymerase [Vibrio cholerae]OSP45540.1 hypothetical protein B7937_17430 [Vibrio cholerae]